MHPKWRIMQHMLRVWAEAVCMLAVFFEQLGVVPEGTSVRQSVCHCVSHQLCPPPHPGWEDSQINQDCSSHHCICEHG
jgi:hypothetical protein